MTYGEVRARIQFKRSASFRPSIFLAASLLAWITLTSPEGFKIYFNVDGVQFVGPTKPGISNGKTEIILSGGNHVYVKEPPEQVIEMIKRAKS